MSRWGPHALHPLWALAVPRLVTHLLQEPQQLQAGCLRGIPSHRGRLVRALGQRPALRTREDRAACNPLSLAPPTPCVALPWTWTPLPRGSALLSELCRNVTGFQTSAPCCSHSCGALSFPARLCLNQCRPPSPRCLLRVGPHLPQKTCAARPTARAHRWLPFKAPLTSLCRFRT